MYFVFMTNVMGDLGYRRLLEWNRCTLSRGAAPHFPKLRKKQRERMADGIAACHGKRLSARILSAYSQRRAFRTAIAMLPELCPARSEAD